MDRIDIASLAVAPIFDYSNPIQPATLADALEEEGYTIPGREADGIHIGGPGINIQQGLPVPGPIAADEGLTIIYNPEANLDGGFPIASFITLKTDQKNDFSFILGKLDNLISLLDELGVATDHKLFEITVEGQIHIGEGHNVSNFVRRDKLSQMDEILGTPARAGAIRFTAEEKVDREDYFKFLADATSSGNPNVWEFKYVTRETESASIDGGSIKEEIRELTDLGMEDE